MYNNGKIKKSVLDQYSRTDQIRSHEKENVKILTRGDEWYYYIENFGGSKYEDTVIQFLDLLGEAIPNLIFQLSNESNKVILVGETDENGEAVFKCPRFNFSLLSVKSIIDNDFKSIIRIENNYVRGITLISPKILKYIDLLQESEEKGGIDEVIIQGNTNQRRRELKMADESKKDQQMKNQNGRSVLVISAEDIKEAARASQATSDWLGYLTTATKVVEKNNFSWGILHSKKHSRI